jgi:hypothetical protein
VNTKLSFGFKGFLDKGGEEEESEWCEHAQSEEILATNAAFETVPNEINITQGSNKENIDLLRSEEVVDTSSQRYFRDP